ncbi:dihydrodipicolinate synthase family protein [Candidatus Vidania fulgoroideorum]
MKKLVIPIITPMKESGKIDFASLKKLISLHIKLNNKNILVNASTSESTSLSNREKIKIIKFIRKIFGKKIVLIAGSCYNSTIESLNLINKYNKEDVDYVLQITPYYYKTSNKGIVNHFRKISKFSKKPLLVYNVPKRTGVDVSENCLQKIFNLENVRGIKDSSEKTIKNIRRIDICNRRKKLFFCGDDLQLITLKNFGTHGIFSVLSNIFSKEIKELILNKKKIKKLSKIENLIVKLSCYRNPSLIKCLLEKIKACNSKLRDPLVKLKGKDRKDVINIVRQYDSKILTKKKELFKRYDKK